MEPLRVFAPGRRRTSPGGSNPPPSRATAAPHGWIVPACIGLVLALLSLPAPRAAEQGSLVPGLLRSLRQIENAFRHADLRSLIAVLPRDSKVLVGMETFSQPKAYYAPDQVVLIFRKVFQEVRVLSFDLEPDGADPHSELVYVPATWSVRRPMSGTKAIRLQFTLRQEGDAYYVRGIKEVN